MAGVVRCMMLLALVAACSASIGTASIPTMRLRGGAWGRKEESQAQMAPEMAVEAAGAPEDSAQPGPPQINLVQHAVEYGLAGGFDGIRSGVGQAVGSQMASWVGGALATSGRGAGFALMSFAGSLPLIRRIRKKAISAPSHAHASQNPQVMQPTGVCVCFVSVPSDEVADVITMTLVQSGLACCVNQVPGVTSTYVWQGKLQRDTETLLIIKTNREQLADVAVVVKDKHPFECPEFICMDVGAGLPDYLAWVRSCAAPQSPM